MGTPQIPEYDLRNFKCVPLDLLRNVTETTRGEYEIALTSDAPTLRDFKEDQRAGMLRAGPIAGENTVSADTIENLMIALFSIFAILVFAVLFYWGFLNLRSEGIGAFQLPPALKGMPVIGLVAIFTAVLFGVGGYFIGAATK